ncbi:MAG TPA: redox-regulated ATPase YchF [Planctomycetota bacterium]|nr:redox-regulated ATPase YchF [Planctomycetota bacterium]
MKIGILGLPSSGKTTVFQALSGFKTDANNFKKETHRAIVKIPDPRLDQLVQYYQPNKTVHATIEYVDVVVENEKKPLSDSILGIFKTMDVFVQVVRAFENQEVPHPKTKIDYYRDLQDMETELILKDLVIVENNLDKLERVLKAEKKQENLLRQEVLLKAKQMLEDGKPLRALSLTPEEENIIKIYQFLSIKPQLIVINIDENQNPEDYLPKAKEYYKDIPMSSVMALCGKIEMEIAQLSPEDQKEFIEELNIQEPALHRMIAESFRLLQLMIFFTVGKDEVRAWIIPQNTKAPQAAGTIHSDFEQGFIRAETFHYDDLVQAEGSEQKVKENGKFRLEGKEYIVKDGDILNIRFNVKKNK